MSLPRVVDLFAGAGGWEADCRELKIIGIEIDRDACQTNAAAGGRVIRGDVTTMDPARFKPLDGLIASPPCTDFSMAGNRAGVDGETGKLVYEVPRWVEGARPRWVACEQVPPVLPMWEQFAHQFQSWGYKTWTGLLNAADYGVPQTRVRAFLLASLDCQPVPPEPTHTRDPHPVLFGEPKARWVSMADALGWGMTDRASMTVTSGGVSTGGAEPFGNGARQSMTRERGRWLSGTGEVRA